MLALFRLLSDTLNPPKDGTALVSTGEESICKKNSSTIILPYSACSCQLALPGQQERLGSNPAQSLMVLGAKVVGAVLVAELVDEQPHNVFGDAVLEPVRAKPDIC